MSKRTLIEKQLRAAIAKDRRSIYRLAVDAGLGIGPTQRFAAGEAGCTLRTATKLCNALGLVLVLQPAKRGR